MPTRSINFIRRIIHIIHTNLQNWSMPIQFQMHHGEKIQFKSNCERWMKVFYMNELMVNTAQRQNCIKFNCSKSNSSIYTRLRKIEVNMCVCVWCIVVARFFNLISMLLFAMKCCGLNGIIRRTRLDRIEFDAVHTVNCATHQHEPYRRAARIACAVILRYAKF